MQVTELMQASGMSFTRFAESLQNVRGAGFIEVSGDPEVARLTDKGKEVAALTNAA